MRLGSGFGRRRPGGSSGPTATDAPGQTPAPDGSDATSDLAAASPGAVVALSHVSKRLSGHLAIDDLTFAIQPGELFALIGPSGSGKTTTVRVICGVYAPDTGQVRLLGRDRLPWPRDLRTRFGYMPQSFSLYPRMTADENLRYAAALHGLPPDLTRRRLSELLELVDLEDQRHRLTGEMSGGQRRRLALAIALIHDPELLFVDEPTAGLDPALRARLWAYFRQLVLAGRSVVVTTQYIDEAELTDRVAIMRSARLIALGTPLDLARMAFGGEIVELRSADLTVEAARALAQVDGVHDVSFVDLETLRVIVDIAEEAAPRLLAVLARQGCTVRSIGLRRPRFEDVFLRLTGVVPPPESAAERSEAATADEPAHDATNAREDGMNGQTVAGEDHEEHADGQAT
jgi:ABC-2 type transport system ATP-binding protein